MVLEPTNWRMTAEQAACWDIGQSPWEPPELPGEKGLQNQSPVELLLVALQPHPKPWFTVQ